MCAVLWPDQATLLEQISETQRESECRMDEIKAALHTKRRSLREQKETLGCLRDKVQELRTLAETMKYNEILGKAYVWKKVRCSAAGATRARRPRTERGDLCENWVQHQQPPQINRGVEELWLLWPG